MRVLLIALTIVMGGAQARAEGPALEQELPDEATQKAEADFRAAVRASKTGSPQTALVLFERALPKKNTTSDIFYNLVAVAKALKQQDKVALYGQSFLALESGTSDAKAIAKDVDDAIASLTKKGLAPVEVNVSAPDGATVLVGDSPVAKGPRGIVRLPPGKYLLRATKEDHLPAAKELLVEAGPAVEVAMTLERVLHRGKLIVITTPPGTMVYIDDKAMGVTPLEIELDVGSRFLMRLEREGYDGWVRYVEVTEQEPTKVTATLEKVARPVAPQPPTKY